jgi:hypothetical protein
MILQYPVRNFRCPFCGAKMYTEEYKGWKPWVCHGCSAELQFSEADGSILQLCFLVVVFVVLYLLGIRGWHLVAGTFIGGFLAAVVLGAPLDRIMPRRLEPFRPLPPLPTPPWKDEKYTTLFPREQIHSDNSTQPGQGEHETPKDS